MKSSWFSRIGTASVVFAFAGKRRSTGVGIAKHLLDMELE